MMGESGGVVDANVFIVKFVRGEVQVFRHGRAKSFSGL